MVSGSYRSASELSVNKKRHGEADQRHPIHYIHDTAVLHLRLLERQVSRSAVARHGHFCRSVANAFNSQARDTKIPNLAKNGIPALSLRDIGNAFLYLNDFGNRDTEGCRVIDTRNSIQV